MRRALVVTLAVIVVLAIGGAALIYTPTGRFLIIRW